MHPCHGSTTTTKLMIPFTTNTLIVIVQTTYDPRRVFISDDQYRLHLHKSVSILSQLLYLLSENHQCRVYVEEDQRSEPVQRVGVTRSHRSRDFTTVVKRTIRQVSSLLHYTHFINLLIVYLPIIIMSIMSTSFRTRTNYLIYFNGFYYLRTGRNSS